MIAVPASFCRSATPGQSVRPHGLVREASALFFSSSVWKTLVPSSILEGAFGRRMLAVGGLHGRGLGRVLGGSTRSQVAAASLSANKERSSQGGSCDPGELKANVRFR